MTELQTEDELYNQFYKKIYSITSDLIRAFKLEHEKFYDHLSSPMLRWLDFRLRYIDPQPRVVLFSDQFPKILPLHIEGILMKLINCFLQGDDINMHQGKGLTEIDDISGKKRGRRTDFLWADWAIHHLHLSQPPNMMDMQNAQTGFYFVLSLRNMCSFSIYFHIKHKIFRM